MSVHKQKLTTRKNYTTEQTVPRSMRGMFYRKYRIAHFITMFEILLIAAAGIYAVSSVLLTIGLMKKSRLRSDYEPTVAKRFGKAIVAAQAIGRLSAAN